MAMMDFTQTPRYQRMMQTLQSIRPEQRAILNTLSKDEQFADEVMRKNLAAIVQKQNTDYANKSYDLNKDYADRSLDLRARAAATNLGLRRREIDANQDQERMATGLGLGQVVAEADFGQRRDAIDLETFKQKQALTNLLKQKYGGV
jgi:hypothetical protein